MPFKLNHESIHVFPYELSDTVEKHLISDAMLQAAVSIEKKQ